MSRCPGQRLRIQCIGRKSSGSPWFQLLRCPSLTFANARAARGRDEAMVGASSPSTILVAGSNGIAATTGTLNSVKLQTSRNAATTHPPSTGREPSGLEALYGRLCGEGPRLKLMYCRGQPEILADLLPDLPAEP